jgi:D-glycero-alpha-D-manno-heptose-7-phosphate kinase
LIISKTPYRISFFGGGTDYPHWYNKYDGEVISATIDKYIYITSRELPNFFEHNFRIVYSKIEDVKKIEQIKHTVVREVLKQSKISHGLEIHYDGDLPARSGMGSSSTFVVGLLKCINALKKKNLTKQILAKKSIELEQKTLRETVGSQDQIAASYGGFNSIKFFKNGNYKVKSLIKDEKELKNLSSKLYLIFTGINRTAKFVANSYVNTLAQKRKSDLDLILQHVKIGKDFLLSKRYDDFGLLLNETWKIKRSLSSKVSNSKIDQLYLDGLNAGASGGKLLGAGGGGFLLFYVKKNEQIRFKKNMSKHTLITFKFSNEGSKIIFKQ